MSGFSSIVLFVYNRPSHTKQTVDALKANDGATDSDLFIYSDGPGTHEHAEAVREVRTYIRNISGFKSVSVYEREQNWGLSRSIISGVSEMLNRFERIIVLEDDLVTSPYFLRFMNDALERYEQDDRVISIHGYMYPVRKELPQTFFIRDTGCWGWATWKRGWKCFNHDGRSLINEIRGRRLSYAFDLDGSYGFTEMLQRQVCGMNDSWAIRWQASAFLADKLTLFPGVSLVNNIGHDDSGTHSSSSDYFAVALAGAPVVVEAIPVEENAEVRNELRKYFISLHATSFGRLAHRVIAALRSIVRLS